MCMFLDDCPGSRFCGGGKYCPLEEGISDPVSDEDEEEEEE